MKIVKHMYLKKKNIVFQVEMNENLIHNHTIIMHKKYFHSWTCSYLFLKFIDHLYE